MHTTKMFILAAVVIYLAAVAAAQQGKPAEQPAVNPTNTYRVQYTVSEVADGKRINSRNYETLAQEPAGGQVSWTQIRMGNRVPIPGEKEPHYLDVGISIDTGLQREGGQMVMKTRFELTSVAPEQGSSGSAVPVLRSIKFNSDHLVSTGQKVLVSSGEDVNTNHRFEVEAMLTRVK
jgi:hypothetical protein